MKHLQIDAHLDFVCPWCFIGMRRLDAVLADHARGAGVQLRHHPYLLHPNAPPEVIDLRASLMRRYGPDLERVLAPVESAARVSGIPMDCSRITRTYSTVAAHTLVRHAQARGVQRPLIDAVFAAYFLEGKNIADVATLADIASRHGFTRAEAGALLADPRELARTRADAAAAMRHTPAVPLFEIGGRRTVRGAQSSDILRRAVADALDAPAAHDHTGEQERLIRDAALDRTIGDSFPASDAPSSIPDPDDDTLIPWVLARTPR